LFRRRYACQINLRGMWRFINVARGIARKRDIDVGDTVAQRALSRLCLRLIASIFLHILFK